MLFHKSKKNEQPTLDDSTAERMLENVFYACNKKPNTVPLSVLMSYSNYRKERFILQKVIFVIIFIFFCLLPLLFIPASFTVEAASTGTDHDPVYEVHVTAPIIPVERVTATIGGRYVPVYETDTHVYQIAPEANGEMIITVVLKNKQTNTFTLTISDVDTKAPVLISHQQSGDNIVLFVEDENSDIDYDNVYAQTSTGECILPVSYNEETGEIDFEYPEEALNIYVPDKAENVLHLILSLY